MNYCYLNGEILKYKDCHLHVSDLLLQRGYGVFDFFRVRNGEIPWLEDYINRLFNSMRLSGIEAPLSIPDFHAIVYDLQQKNVMKNGAFKVIVSGGYSDNLESVSGSPNIIIINIPWNSPPSSTFENGIKLITQEYSRPDPEIKTLFYFNLLKMQSRLKEFGAVDVMYHNTMITETSRANVFLLKGNNIYTPASNILYGVTRKQILSMHTDISIQDIAINQLYDFDEMFICSTSRELTPVVAVNGRKIGKGVPGKHTRDIMAAFREIIA